ncbi:MAG: VOC family protein [Acidimicrobiales bacterium]
MSLVQGPIYQVAWVVDDIAAAERWFTDTFGVASWTRFDDVVFGPDSCTYRGRPADYSIHVGIGYAGTQQLELIQPVTGVNLYTEHLERCGPGLHHVAYLPDDFDATLADAADRGIEVIQRGVFEGLMEFAYLDGRPGGAGAIELMRLSDDMRRFFDSLGAEASLPARRPTSVSRSGAYAPQSTGGADRSGRSRARAVRAPDRA